MTLTAEERTGLATLAQDLPAIWHADTATDQERKQPLRFAIVGVDLDGVTRPGQVTIQIHRRSGACATIQVDRSRLREGSPRTPAAALALIRDPTPHAPGGEISRDL